MKLYDFAPWNLFVQRFGVRKLYLRVGEDDKLVMMNHEKSEPEEVDRFDSVDEAIRYVKRRKGWLK